MLQKKNTFREIMLSFVFIALMSSTRNKLLKIIHKLSCDFSFTRGLCASNTKLISSCSDPSPYLHGAIIVRARDTSNAHTKARRGMQITELYVCIVSSQPQPDIEIGNSFRSRCLKDGAWFLEIDNFMIIKWHYSNSQLVVDDDVSRT